MISRHVIYCDHYPDGAGEAGSNARERKPATVSHEFVSCQGMQTSKFSSTRTKQTIMLGTIPVSFLSSFKSECRSLLTDSENTGSSKTSGCSSTHGSETLTLFWEEKRYMDKH